MQKHRYIYRKLLAAMLAVTMLIAAGCQSISNVDLNKVIKNSLLVKSGESKSSLEFQLLLDEASLNEWDEQEAALLKLISHVKLEVNEAKVQDQYHMSYKGNIVLGGETRIGFSAKFSKELGMIEIEGAKAPFTFDMTGRTLNSMLGYDIEEEPQVDDAVATAFGYDLINKASGYFIDNLPNPEQIKVSSAVETVNGSSMSLMNVHTEFKGSELGPWLKKYVNALAADEDGLDKMIAGVAEVFANYPEIWQAAGTVNPFESTGGLDAPTTQEIVKMVSTELKELLEELQQSFNEPGADEAVAELFNDDLNLKADFYVDNKLDIRKQAIELSYAPTNTDMDLFFPFKGIKVKSTSELWNVNGTVKADAPSADEQAVQLESMFDMQGYQALKLFDEQSAIYDLLKNKLHITHQTVVMYSDDYYLPPILTKSYVTIIPLRYTVEQLGGTIEYNPATKEVTVFDDATGTTIVIKSGSNQAIVNGKAETWPLNVVTIDGSMYVPARAFAEAIGAEVSWEKIYEGVNMFTLEREL